MLNSTRGDIVGDCPRCGEHSIVDPQVLNALSQTTRGPDDVSVYSNPVNYSRVNGNREKRVLCTDDLTSADVEMS